MLLGIKSIGDCANSKIMPTTKHMSNNKTTTSMIIIMFVHGKFLHLIETARQADLDKPSTQSGQLTYLGSFQHSGGNFVISRKTRPTSAIFTVR